MTRSLAVSLAVALLPSCLAPIPEPDSGAPDAAIDGGDLADSGSPPPPVLQCWADSAFLNRNNPDLVSATIGDVSGDGVPERARVVPGSLELGPGLYVGLSPAAEYDLRVLVADLDADGRPDLLLGSPRDDLVEVFLGPITASRGWGAADLVFQGGNPGGLSHMFGSALVVADLTGDGVPDLLVTSPSEREEASGGEQPPRVFPGPFASGESWSIDAGFPLGGTVPFMPRCVGESSRCVDGGFQLPTGPCVEYLTPVQEGAVPRPCP